MSNKNCKCQENFETNEEQIRESDEEIIICNDEESELDKAKRQNAELFDRLLRLQAEFDNYRKRTNETNKTVRTDGQKDVIEKLLPVIDATEQALVVIQDESVLKGLSLILVKLADTLESFGVKKIDTMHCPIDPNIHEIIAVKPNPSHAGKVVEVFRSGYTINGRVLRPASVIVGE